MTHYPDASFRAVTRTGLDTLFAVAWADLDDEPLVLSVPDTGGRYYVIALFDMWSNVFASIGKRTTGTAAAHFLVAGPGWQGTPPADVTQTTCPRRAMSGLTGRCRRTVLRVRGGDRDAKAVHAHPAQRLGHDMEPPRAGSRAPRDRHGSAS